MLSSLLGALSRWALLRSSSSPLIHSSLMRILVLLTLTEIAGGLREICDGRINGVYATSICSNKYNQCFNGHLTTKTCPSGLVFNPDSNQCDFDRNVDGCAARTKVSCENRKDGSYAVGCSSSFFFCSNGVIHRSTCQHGLYYDVDRRLCDQKFRVRACGGHPEVEREPITRSPMFVPTYEPQALKSYAKVSGFGPITVDPAVNCQGKANGAYPIGTCLQQYVTCADGISQLAECASGKVFKEGTCLPYNEVSECLPPSLGSPEADSVGFDCSTHKDGYYGFKCSSDFVSCSGGVLRMMRCPSSLVFNEVEEYCDYPGEDCTSEVASIPSSAATKAVNGHASSKSSVDTANSVSSVECEGKKEGYYAKGCSADFFYCSEGVATYMKCPSSLVFNEKDGRCDYAKKCSNDGKIHSPPAPDVHTSAEDPMVLSTSVDCEGRKDGYYAKGCSSEFVYCNEGVATYMNCPLSLVYNEKSGHCDNVESCSHGAGVHLVQAAQAQTNAIAQVQKTSASHSDCNGRKEGYYSKGCTSEFIYCSSEGVATYMKCPSSLVFNETNGYCDYPGSCSETTEIKPSHAAVPSGQGTARVNIDCSLLPDGRYGSQCSPTFTICSNGTSHSKKCAGKLVFDVKSSRCDFIHDCNGQHDSQKTLSDAPHYFTNKVSRNECTNKSDGIHSLGCISEFLQCVDGVAYNLDCPAGLVFVEEVGVCDYPSVCSQHPSRKTANLPIPYEAVPDESSNNAGSGPACDNDGYISRTCTSEYFNCVGGRKFVGRCPDGLVFNIEKVHCDSLESCLHGELEMSPAAQPVPTTVVDKGFSCKHRSDGVVKDFDCQPRFTTCLNGTAFVTNCPYGLVYSVTSKKCGYPDSCEGNSDRGTSSHPTSTISPKNSPHLNSGSVQYQDTVVGAHLCSDKVDGPLNFTDCRPSSSFCANGSLYSIKCTDGLLYSFTSRRCELPSVCGGRENVAPAAIPVTDPPTSVQCTASVASGSCSANFLRCKDGRLEPAQCPGQSLFDSNLLLCVYDLPECKTNHPSTIVHPPSVTQRPEFLTTSTTYDVPVTSAGRTYPTHSFLYTYPRIHKFGSYRGSPFAWNYPVQVPLRDSMLGRGKVNRAPIRFEERSILAGNRRQKVFDDFDGYVSPWLWPGIDRIFVPNPYERHRHRDSGSQSHEENNAPTPLLDDNGTVFKHPAGEEKVEFPEHEELDDDVPMTYDVTSHYEDEVIEGSGEDVMVRRRRSSQDRRTNDFSMCTPSNSPGLVPIGFCSQDFLLCLSVGDGVLAACPVGDLFDNSSKKCVTSTSCGDIETVQNLRLLVTQHGASSSVLSIATKQECLESSDHDMECTGKFMKCVHGRLYVMKCPEGLVFDRLKNHCNYPFAVVACRGQSMLKHFRTKFHMDQPTDRTSTGDPIVPVVNGVIVNHAKVNTSKTNKDPCSTLSDGLHSEGCTKSFVVCYQGHTQATMECPLGTWFDESRAICDNRDKIIACGGSLTVPKSSTHTQNPMAVRTVSATFFDDSCPTAPQPVARCSSKYLLCSKGIRSEYHCSSPLVFNSVTMACDYREFVPECQDFKRQDFTTASTPSSTALSCVYSKDRPALALEFCGRTYGVCSEQGVLIRKECSVGFLFDSHLNTCVPAEQCGQERLKDLLSKVTFAPPVTGSQPDEPWLKNEKKKDDRCRNTVEGALKPLGRCRSSYIRCTDGRAVIEPCSTTAEVFSSAVGACVMRINAPECHDKPQRTHAPQSVASNDAATFCKSRSDGLYRNPADCAGILQCFGGDVFEYPSCSSGLVFNEETGKCDYRDSVPECQVDADETNLLKGCRGVGHGDFVADESNCNQFYRCVWDRLVRMQCPSGTVFNPELSVCDWPINVPQCTAHRVVSV